MFMLVVIRAFAFYGPMGQEIGRRSVAVLDIVELTIFELEFEQELYGQFANADAIVIENDIPEGLEPIMQR